MRRYKQHSRRWGYYLGKIKEIINSINILFLYFINILLFSLIALENKYRCYWIALFIFNSILILIQKNKYTILLILFYLLLSFYLGFKTRGFNETTFLIKIIEKKNKYFIGEYKFRQILFSGNISGIKIGDFIKVEGKFVNFDSSWYKGYNEKIYYFSRNIFSKFDILSSKKNWN